VSKKKRGIPVQKETVEKEKAATDNTGAAAASRDVDEVGLYIHCSSWSAAKIQLLTSLWSASCISWQRDTARSSSAAIDQYLLLSGPTAANPPQRCAAAE